MFKGQKAGNNPWEATTLEWNIRRRRRTITLRASFLRFTRTIRVFGSRRAKDFMMQTEPEGAEVAAGLGEGSGNGGTVTGTDRVIDTTVGGSRLAGATAFRRNGADDATRGGDSFRFSADRYRIGVWVAIGSILMLFVALASSYIVRSASGNDWQPIAC